MTKSIKYADDAEKTWGTKTRSPYFNLWHTPLAISCHFIALGSVRTDPQTCFWLARYASDLNDLAFVTKAKPACGG